MKLKEGSDGAARCATTALDDVVQPRVGVALGTLEPLRLHQPVPLGSCFSHPQGSSHPLVRGELAMNEGVSASVVERIPAEISESEHTGAQGEGFQGVAGGDLSEHFVDVEERCADEKSHAADGSHLRRSAHQPLVRCVHQYAEGKQQPAYAGAFHFASALAQVVQHQSTGSANAS
eukprot:jgi/Chrpa1/538/Chrysochromulina_OHIO_Genome00010519-RA